MKWQGLTLIPPTFSLYTFRLEVVQRKYQISELGEPAAWQMGTQLPIGSVLFSFCVPIPVLVSLLTSSADPKLWSI